MEDILIKLKKVSENIKPNDLLNKAFDFGISKSHLKVIITHNHFQRVMKIPSKN